MLQLELLLDALAVDGSVCDEDFRIFFLTLGTDNFPTSILLNGLKVIFEPPLGLRANMLQTHQSLVTEDLISSCNNPSTFKKLIMSTIFFHAVANERQRFGSLGFSHSYSFLNA